MGQFNVNVVSEVVSDNKEVFGGVEVNRRLFKKYLEDIYVPNGIYIKIIDMGVSCNKYFEVAERLAENHNNKIIFMSATSIMLIKPAVGEKKFLNLYAKSNVFSLVTPVGFGEVKALVDVFIKFHSPKLEEI